MLVEAVDFQGSIFHCNFFLNKATIIKYQIGTPLNAGSDVALFIVALEKNW